MYVCLHGYMNAYNMYVRVYIHAMTYAYMQ